MIAPADITIRAATPADLEALLDAERAAFGEPDEADLAAALIAGAGFVPKLNLIALAGDCVIGHVLFTRARAGENRATLLAPLAVVPERQRSGVGSALAVRGLEVARTLGFEIALVLGHPQYYPRFGFRPAFPLGIEAPYPIDPPEAWMALELVPGAFGRAAGVVEVAEELRAPEMWRE